jgi:hypothetical protein
MENGRKTNREHHTGYVCGWLDSSIPDFLAELPRNSEDAAFALITCLDSNTDLPLLWKKNEDLRTALRGAVVHKTGLLVPFKMLLEVSLRSQLFFGFDEIWLFPTANIDPKPKSATIVGPHRIEQEMLEKVGHWMDTNGCALALGDGVGLNLILKADGLTKHVISHSLSQPEPTFRMNDLWVQDEEKKSTTAKTSKFRGIDDA